MDERIPVLEMKDISKSFPGVRALNNVSLKVHSGECLALIGENGAGKSTLMKILSGAYMKDEGDIFLNGERIDIRNPHDGLRKGIGIIYQELSLVMQFTGIENMFVGHWKKDRFKTVDWKGMSLEFQTFFANLGLSIKLNIPVRQLSVAECQLIEIARAVHQNSKIIIMDEPTSSLTNTEIEVLFQLIKDLKQKNIAIIFISHKLEELFRICDRVTVLKDGCNSGDFSMEGITKENMVRAMVGRDISEYYPVKTYKPTERVVFEAHNVTNGNRAKGISFKVHAGEILGFAGLVGAGRTETMRAIFRADSRSFGEFYMDGKKLTLHSPADAIRNGIAFATEDRRFQGLVLKLSIAQNITMANMGSVANKQGILNLKKEIMLAEKYRESLSIRTPNVHKKVVELSGGNQQKVVIAKWLNTNVKLFIFDEPTRGIDVGAKAEIYQLMCSLAAQGAAVIMVSSELPEILGVSDRVIVLHDGIITGEFINDNVSEELLMTAAVGGKGNG